MLQVYLYHSSTRICAAGRLSKEMWTSLLILSPITTSFLLLICREVVFYLDKIIYMILYQVKIRSFLNSITLACCILLSHPPVSCHYCFVQHFFHAFCFLDIDKIRLICFLILSLSRIGLRLLHTIFHK